MNPPEPGGGPFPAASPPPIPPPRRPRWDLVIAGVAALAAATVALLWFVSVATGPDPAVSPPATTNAPTPIAPTTIAPTTAAPTTTASPAAIGDGTWAVGSEVKPGTYRTTGADTAAGHSNCYWARLSGFSGESDDVLANGNTTGPARVTIAPTDKGFTSDGCAPWQRVR